MKLRRLLLVAMLISLALGGLAGGRNAAARDDSAPRVSLVRVNLAGPADVDVVRTAAIPAIARLADAAGQEYLLALLSTDQQKALNSGGLSWQVLDADAAGASYYLVGSRTPQALESLQGTGILLAVDGSQAIARMSATLAEQLPLRGFEIRRLGPDPIVLAEPATTPAFPQVITPDPTIQQIINQVSSSTVWDYDGNLSGINTVIVGGAPYTIQTRNSNSGTPIQKATQYVYEHFQALGLDVSYHVWSGDTRPNVIAEQPGLTHPEQIYLITAHLDDMPSGSTAPGADDNASGSVGVLIAADILSQYQFDSTVRYVLFTGEEQGLLGSDAYAQYVHDQGDQIMGVLNLDMIAYNSDAQPIIDLHTRSGSAGAPDLAIANLFSDVVEAYGIDLTPNIFQDNIQYSDHASFWDRGYAAILGIEDDDDFTPYYHTTGDTRSTLNKNYFTSFIQASIGTFVYMGGLLPPSGHIAGTVKNAQGAPVSGAALTARLNASTSWETTSGSNGSYHFGLIPGTYSVEATAPGYMAYATTGITVTADTTTTLNITLEVTPTYTVTGYVQDLYAGEPLSATVSVVEEGLTVHTNPATGAYSIPLMMGSYTLRAEAENFHSQTQSLNLTGNQQLDFELQSICLLVLDDDGGATYDAYYTASLGRLGFSDYTILPTLPGDETLALYRGLVWLTGDQSGNTLTTADQAQLARYLDAGGRLFLSGQDIGHDIGNSDFFGRFLHAQFINDNAGKFSLQGLDFLAPLVNIFLQGPGGANNQASPDAIAPAQGSTAVYQYTSSSLYGGVAYSGVGRVVYFSFGFEAINRAQDRDAVLDATLDYLGICETPAAPQALFTSQAQHTSVQFTNASAGTPSMSYTWDFGDNTPASSAANPAHVYAASGTYTVTLTVSSRFGEDTYSTQVTVSSPAATLYLPLVKK